MGATVAICDVGGALRRRARAVLLVGGTDAVDAVMELVERVRHAARVSVRKRRARVAEGRVRIAVLSAVRRRLRDIEMYLCGRTDLRGFFARDWAHAEMYAFSRFVHHFGGVMALTTDVEHQPECEYWRDLLRPLQPSLPATWIGFSKLEVHALDVARTALDMFVPQARVWRHGPGLDAFLTEVSAWTALMCEQAMRSVAMRGPEVDWVVVPPFDVGVDPETGMEVRFPATDVPEKIGRRVQRMLFFDDAV